MALIDRARDVYFDRARERWKQKGFDADITDILEDYRAETNKKIKREAEEFVESQKEKSKGLEEQIRD